MKLQSTAVFVLACLIAGSTVSYADMIEIRNRGFLNGKILSQDPNEVKFEDSKKNVITVPKSDVLFLEVQKDAPVVERPKPRPAPWSKKIQRWKDRAGRFYHDARRAIQRRTERVVNFIQTPLDRSGVDAKTDEFAKSMDSLANSLGKISKNDKKRREGLKMMTEDYFERRDDSSTR